VRNRLPYLAQVAKLSDEWMAPTQGTDAALAMTMGHVILKEYHLDNKSDYFTSYIKQYTDSASGVRVCGTLEPHAII
jgi:nitrate reductase alpha subunit